MRETLHAYYQLYGYSPHGLVAISESASGWESTRAHGAVTFLEVGRTWLASEPLSSEADLETVTAEFLEYAAGRKRLVAFVPVTERFARAGVRVGLDCIPVGKSPYFNLAEWNLSGKKLGTVRNELNKARREGVVVECVPGAQLPREEAERLQELWIGTRRSTGFGWVFASDTFSFPTYQKHFLARAADGRLVGLLSAAPLPARNGYYFKDLHRHPEAPKGTSDLLIVSGIEHLRAGGFSVATPGTVPLHGIDDPAAVRHGNYAFLMRMMNMLEKRGEKLYGFSGLYVWKSRFAPSWWELEYALAPRALFSELRVGLAAARATATGGIFNALLKAALNRS
jgi:phosphatidylglycerol lysyltransferase